ncbi:MAG: IPTL-CTERM sorting domain-containing protein [Deltaproteobacteria bacterium]|nr:IPTL-CTERM sorting domain-containing protein [Deltaproteobacteria bacterium]
MKQYKFLFTCAMVAAVVLCHGALVCAATVELPVGLNGPFTSSVYWSGVGLADGDDFDVEDAFGFGFDDAYDGFWKLAVDGTDYEPAADADLVSTEYGKTVTGSTVAMSGMNVTQQYTAFCFSPTLRVWITVENPTGSAITVPIIVSGDLGSDDDTTVEATSSGDATFDASDRWLVTDGDPDDPVNTFVFFGLGSPAAMPTAAELANDDEIDVDFQVTVPAHSTRYLLFFSQVSRTVGDAIGGVSEFNSLPALEEAGLLCGLNRGELKDALNWNGYVPIPSLGKWGMVFLVVLMVGFSFRQVRKRIRVR